ncbi:DinB family protein [Paenalkalicoccus suaedae]|uniref:DinB family protein n=1 Tax=Paenalkalicoccus suaedae TaxID=2592382 RepID=A0A859FJA8_9BACI|nr:DinB family protein [Paenalkalicoccus suaedae]QKS72776.1 DinB family protein [Paenalkalicoccus suaedae]
MKKSYESLLQTAETVDGVLQESNEMVLTKPYQPGKWSTREIVGHMLYWDKYILEELVPQMTEGAQMRDFPNHDTFNAAAIGALSGRSAAYILRTFVGTRRELASALAAVDQDATFKIGKSTRAFTAEKIARIFVKHDEHHLKQIHAAIERG